MSIYPYNNSQVISKSLTIDNISEKPPENPLSNALNDYRAHGIKNSQHEKASVGLTYNFFTNINHPLSEIEKHYLYPVGPLNICIQNSRYNLRSTIIFNTSSTAAANAQAKNNSKNAWHARSLGQCKFNNNGNPQCPRKTKSKYTFFQH